MSAVDALVTIGPVISALEAFPVWGPVLAVVTAVLLVQAYRETWGTRAEDTSGDAVPVSPPGVPPAGDRGGDTAPSPRLACGDTDPRVSHWPGPGGGG
ncbi:hypothetical protein [Streptomyces variabilis]